MAQNDSQKAPYEQNATAPKVLPVRNSHRPATNWARPPYVSASANTMGSPLSDTRPELNMLRTNVVSAKAARPSGPGSAIAVGMKLTSWRAVVPAVGSAPPSRTVRRSTDEASIALLLLAGTGERARSTGWPCDSTHEPICTRAGPGSDHLRPAPDPRPSATSA